MPEEHDHDDDVREDDVATNNAPKGAQDDALNEGGKKALESERKARKDAEKAAKELSARLRQYEDKDRTEAERLTARAEEAERDREKAVLRANDLTRRVVAQEHGLPSEMADRLVGDTEQDLREDAQRLASLVAPARPRPGGFGGGPRGAEAADDPKLRQGQAILDGLTRRH